MWRYLKLKSLLEQWYLTDKGIHSLEQLYPYLQLFFRNSNIDNLLQIGSISDNYSLAKILGAKNYFLVENHKIPLTEHIIGDLELLPILEDYFDVVVIPHTLEISDPNSILFESYRVLKPGGIMIIIGFDVNLVNMMINRFNNNSIHKKYTGSANLIHVKNLNSKLASAGFELINNKSFCVKRKAFIKYLLYIDIIQKMFNGFAGDIYVSISRKKIANLDSIKNRNRLFSRKTVSMPGDTAWD